MSPARTAPSSTESPRSPTATSSTLLPSSLPDGKRIVFTRFHLDHQGHETSALYVVNVNGRHATRLDATADLHPGYASWSPDGKTLVFETLLFPSSPSAPTARTCANLTDNATRWLLRSATTRCTPQTVSQIMLLSSERTQRR